MQLRTLNDFSLVSPILVVPVTGKIVLTHII